MCTRSPLHVLANQRWAFLGSVRRRSRSSLVSHCSSLDRSDQKDLLISQLKAEIFEIQQRDKDYLALRDQLYAIQTKYRHLQDEKLLQENEFKTRQDSNCITLHGLKKECDDARHHLNDKNRCNNDM